MNYRDSCAFMFKFCSMAWVQNYASVHMWSLLPLTCEALPINHTHPPIQPQILCIFLSYSSLALAQLDKVESIGVAGQVVSVGVGEVAWGIVRLIATTAVTGMQRTSIAATRAAVTGACDQSWLWPQLLVVWTKEPPWYRDILALTDNYKLVSIY